MESGNFFENYANYISELQNRLLRIQLRYNEGQSWAMSDYEKGLLSKEDFNKIYNCRMDTIVEGVDSKYLLSSEDIEYVVKFGDLDVNGQLLQTILRKDLLERAEMVQDIFDSVVKFAYFESFDGITKRMKFKEDVVKTFGEQKKKSLAVIERIKQSRGESYQSSPQYAREAQRLDNANKALSFAEHIITFDDKYLITLLSSYYDIKYKYYDWYRRMSLKEENDNGFIYQEHYDLMKELNGDISCLDSKKSLLEEEQSDIKRYTDELLTFLEAIAEFDLTKYEPKKEKKSIFRRNVEDDNKVLLFEVFKGLILLPGTFNYIINCLTQEADDENKAYDAKKAFDKFFEVTYGEDITYVLPIDFVNDFRRAVTAYDKKIISQYEEAIERSKKGVGDFSRTLDVGFGRALSQSQVINDIHLGYTGKESVLLPGFTFEELESMYFSLKSYIIDNVTNEKGLDSTIKKV